MLIEANGAELHYEERGEGAPLILIASVIRDFARRQAQNQS